MFEMDKESLAYGVTPLENRFLLEYLPSAKGDYVKVYLWGLFACSHKGPDYTPEDMSKDLFLTVPEIEAALRYWERRGLICRVSDDPQQYRFYSPMQRTNAPTAIDLDMAYVNFAEAVYAAFSEKRKVNPSEISLAWEWVQDMGLSPEAALMLIHHCMAQCGPQFSFKAAEKLVVRMKEAGVKTSEDADSFLQHNQAVHDGVRKVLSRMGKRRLPTDDELALYEKWVSEWQFERQAILDACKEMTSGDPSFKYLDKILDGLRNRSEARTGKQVAQLLKEEQAQKDLAQEVFTRLGVRLSGPAAALEYKTLLEIQPHGVLLLAADYCRRNNLRLEDMQRVLEGWKQKGYETEESVREYLDKQTGMRRLLLDVFEACGHRGNPTVTDMVQYQKWHRDWGFNHEMICSAAEQARNAENGRITYLNKVLETWHEAGIKDISQVQAKKAPVKKKTVTEQQYTQREYTEEELLAVSDDLIEEARKRRGKPSMESGTDGV
ncbi:MAG: DnaD domain protein [Clostridia bacterium]|nr:DnaD domain protein [Clostridia bacterium]